MCRDATASNRSVLPHYQWVSQGKGMMLNTDMVLYKVLFPNTYPSRSILYKRVY
jgi:hypothetical protein